MEQPLPLTSGRRIARPLTILGAPLARVAAAAFALFALTTVVGAIATPGYNSIEEHISALGAQSAPHPGIMVVGHLALAIAALAAAAALHRTLGGRAGRVAVILLAAAGVCLFGAAFAHEDCSTALDACRALEESGRVSGQHTVHELVSLLSFVLTVGALFAGARAVRLAGGDARSTRVVAIACVVLMVLIGARVPAGIEGLEQRVFVVLAYGWPIVLALRGAGARGTDR